jgi:opacity protein-like surface antigen
MRKSFLIVGAILLSASVVAAADVPKAEAFLGYNYARLNPDSPFVPSFNANGGSGQFVYNVNRWIAGVGDFGAIHNGSLLSSNADTTIVNFVAGPRATYRNESRFTPFIQALFGGAYSTTSALVSLLPGDLTILPPGLVATPGVPISARLHASHTGFAMLVGGGLDIKINKRMSFRPIGADYYLMRLPNLLTGNTTNRNNFRYSAGVNFLFGAQ